MTERASTSRGARVRTSSSPPPAEAKPAIQAPLAPALEAPASTEGDIRAIYFYLLYIQAILHVSHEERAPWAHPGASPTGTAFVRLSATNPLAAESRRPTVTCKAGCPIYVPKSASNPDPSRDSLVRQSDGPVEEKTLAAKAP